MTNVDPKRSLAAERMWLHRLRRTVGTRCISLPVYEREVRGLIEGGYLEADYWQNREAIARAMRRYLDERPPKQSDG